ncbi:MAG: ribonuclease H-like domain-containing protein [Desulfohalobiaceae bacterium]
MGISRSGELQERDGYFAVLLWQDYKQRKSDKSLETLLAYNIQDVLSLEQWA